MVVDCPAAPSRTPGSAAGLPQVCYIYIYIYICIYICAYFVDAKTSFVVCACASSNKPNRLKSVGRGDRDLEVSFPAIVWLLSFML